MRIRKHCLWTVAQSLRLEWPWSGVTQTEATRVENFPFILEVTPLPSSFWRRGAVFKWVRKKIMKYMTLVHAKVNVLWTLVKSMACKPSLNNGCSARTSMVRQIGRTSLRAKWLLLLLLYMSHCASWRMESILRLRKALAMIYPVVLFYCWHMTLLSMLLV